MVDFGSAAASEQRIRVLSGLASASGDIAGASGRVGGFAVFLHSRQPRQLVPMAACILSCLLCTPTDNTNSVTRGTDRCDRGHPGFSSAMIETDVTPLTTERNGSHCEWRCNWSTLDANSSSRSQRRYPLCHHPQQSHRFTKSRSRNLSAEFHRENPDRYRSSGVILHLPERF